MSGITTSAVTVVICEALDALTFEEEWRCACAVLALTYVGVGVTDTTRTVSVGCALDTLTIEQMGGGAFAGDTSAADSFGVVAA